MLRGKQTLRNYSKNLTIPSHIRLKTLSKLFGITSKNLLENISIQQKNKNRLLCKYNNNWYEFKNINDVIIPYNIVEKLGKQNNKNIIFNNYHELQLQQNNNNNNNNNENSNNNNSNNKIPVIALLGHFNHGKTTLLDSFAGSKLVSQEAHGITQEVRTKYVQIHDENDNKVGVTLVDTPGQEIFYRMRSYGASVADIGLLLVAANDGVCNQTQESIGALEDMNIPVIVCLNKIDHPEVLPVQKSRIEEITQTLRDFLILEKAKIIPISALLGTNLPLLEKEICQLIKFLPKQKNKISLTTQQNLAPKYLALGTVLNIWTNPNEGQMIHIVVTDGELFPGLCFSSGGWAGVVVVVYSDDSTPLQGKPAIPGMGVKIRISTKMNVDPRPIGDKIYFFKDIETALEIADFRYMEEVIEHHRIPSELLESYGLKNNDKNSKNKKKKLIDDVYEDETSNISSEVEENEGGDNQKFNNINDLTEKDISLVSGLDYQDIIHPNEVKSIISSNESNIIDIQSTESLESLESTESLELTSNLSSTTSKAKIVHKGKEYVEDEDEFHGRELVIIKANTDLALCTFFDSLEEVKERLEELKEQKQKQEEEQKKYQQKSKKNQSKSKSKLNSNDSNSDNNNSQDQQFYERSRAELEVLQSNIDEIKLREIVRGGLGSITIADVMIADSAKAPILTYEVGIHADALKYAENKKVQIYSFNKMQDIVDLLHGKEYEKYSNHLRQWK